MRRSQAKSVGRLRGAKGDSKKSLFGAGEFDTAESRQMADPYVFYHEFLYLVCNSLERED